MASGKYIKTLLDSLKEEFGELSEDERNKVIGWSDLVKVLGKKGVDVESYVRELLRAMRKQGGIKHESEK